MPRLLHYWWWRQVLMKIGDCRAFWKVWASSQRRASSAPTCASKATSQKLLATTAETSTTTTTATVILRTKTAMTCQTAQVGYFLANFTSLLEFSVSLCWFFGWMNRARIFVATTHQSSLIWWSVWKKYFSHVVCLGKRGLFSN